MRDMCDRQKVKINKQSRHSVVPGATRFIFLQQWGRFLSYFVFLYRCNSNNAASLLPIVGCIVHKIGGIWSLNIFKINSCNFICVYHETKHILAHFPGSKSVSYLKRIAVHLIDKSMLFTYDKYTVIWLWLSW